MQVLKRWLYGLWLMACVLAVTALGGCQRPGFADGRQTPSEDTAEEPPPADPETCQCTPVAPFGFFGPSIVGWGPTLKDIHCPAEASLAGFNGLVLTQQIRWARECLITPLPTCNKSGFVCAPAPPLDFALCIYRGEDFTCPGDYPNRQTALETNGDDLVMDGAVTLCCAEGRPPG